MQLTFAAYFLEVGQTVIGKSNGVRYKDGNKNFSFGEKAEIQLWRKIIYANLFCLVRVVTVP